MLRAVVIEAEACSRVSFVDPLTGLGHRQGLLVSAQLAMSEGAAAHKRCLRFRERALKNPRVQHLLEAINGLGCRTGGFENFVECISKNQQPSVPMMGGFAPHTGKEVDYRPRIVMVEEHNLDQPTFDRTLTHELIHAFDQCRANVDWSNPMHLACSEVRVVFNHHDG